MNTTARVILHVDMDAFYASVEQRDCPAWRGKPLVVGAQPGKRGVVSAASYEARAFGIRSAMAVSQAYLRCPQAIFAPPRMEVYARESRFIMAILQSFSPQLEQVSVDEAFLDISGTQKLLGSPLDVAAAIRCRIRTERSLSASIGIAPNKFLAKIASDCNKPDGVTLVPFEPAAIQGWLAPLAVGRMWGVGTKTAELLARRNIHTIGDLQQLSAEQLSRLLGKNGLSLYQLSRGIDSREVCCAEEAKSLSREHTFERDSSQRELWQRTLLTLCHDVAARARSQETRGRTVVLTWRGADFTRHSRRKTLSSSINTGKELYDTVVSMLAAIPPTTSLRLIGVGLSSLGEQAQQSLFAPTDAAPGSWEASERAVDAVVRKFGKGVVRRGGEGLGTD
jgi:DNA polymerase-4